MITIGKVAGELPVKDFDEMIAISKAEGFNMVEKLAMEWQDGTLRFDKKGEALFIARDANGRIVGVGGRIIDPYLNDPKVARARRVSVMPEVRRQGVARRLMQEIMSSAKGVFSTLRLKTTNPEAGRFYESLGFTYTEGAFDNGGAAYQIDI